MNKKRIALISVTAVALVACIAVAVTFIVLNSIDKGHRFGDWQLIHPATCTEYGLERRDCIDCDEYEERPVTRLGHDFAETNVCKTCSYEIPVTDGLRYILSSDDSYSVDGATLESGVKVVYVPRYYEGLPVDAVAYRGFAETDITEIYLPDGLKQVGMNAFSGCSELRKCGMSIKTELIDLQAFNNCTALEEIEIAPGAEIGDNTFKGCISLASVTIPDGVSKVGFGAFSDCTALTSISIGADLGTLSNSMFSGCTALTKLVLPEGVTKLDAYAFRDCTALKEITVSKSLKEIGGAAFESCSAIRSIRYAGKKSAWKNMVKAQDWLAGVDVTVDFIVYCADGTLNRWNVEVTV